MKQDYSREYHLEMFETEKACNETLKFFVAEVPEHLATILTAINYKECDKAANLAKTIKVTAKIIGASAIEAIAADIEHAIRDNPDLNNQVTNHVTGLCELLLAKNAKLKEIAKQYIHII